MDAALDPAVTSTSTATAASRLRRAHRIVLAALVATVVGVVGWTAYGAGRNVGTSDLAEMRATIDDQGARLGRQNQTIAALATAQDRLAQLLDNRASNAAHVACTEELLLRLIEPLASYVVDPGSSLARGRFLGAVAAIEEGIDGDGIDDCPPLPRAS